MSTSSSSKNTSAAGGGGNIPSGGSQGPVKKTNVCLICGIYTNLSLNIFEPRSGPNIREVIYQKYNFKVRFKSSENRVTFLLQLSSSREALGEIIDFYL